MSNLLENNQTMPHQISPKDIPPVGENSGSEEDEPVPPVIFENLSSSDDDAENMEDEEEVNLGYVELAQDEGDSEQATNLWSSQEEQVSAVDNELPFSVTAGNKSVRCDDTEMKQEQVDLIRQVMTGITLPSSSMPDWAKVIPEENWKASLVSSITNRSAPLPDRENTY
ncbi:uncharacterized protein [Montipora capricornis]|uniref:uncharacterized protein n=1 Tax=Montipora capricornis TaxID=246305 RepID=UPI0035F1DE61